MVYRSTSTPWKGEAPQSPNFRMPLEFSVWCLLHQRILLDAAKVHCDAAEQAEQQNKQKMEVARQIGLAEEARRRAEEQRKFQLERRREENELKQVKQQEEHFQRVKEQWKTSSHTPGKRKDRSKTEDEVVGNKKRRRKGIRRKDQKTKMQYGEEEEDEYKDEPEADDDYADLARYNGADSSERAPDHLLAATGLDDSDVFPKEAAKFL